MTRQELFTTLMERLRDIAEKHDLLEQEVRIECKALTPEEAIGNTVRKDFPILVGKDVMMQAEFDGGIGQAFTSSPVQFRGSLKDVLEMDIINDSHDRTIFISTLNAVMRRLGMCDCSIHCKDNGPEDCALRMTKELKERYGQVKITQIGYQPAVLENISKEFEVRVLDLDPGNVGEVRYGVRVLDGIKDYEESVKWADLILCTGSTLGNGTVVDFLELDKEVLFYGTTAAGAAALLGWKRICYAD